MSRIDNFEKIENYCSMFKDFSIYTYCFYYGICCIIDVENYDKSVIEKIIDLCDNIYGDSGDAIEIGKEVASCIFQEKQIPIEVIKKIPLDDLVEEYEDDRFESLQSYNSSEKELEIE